MTVEELRDQLTELMDHGLNPKATVKTYCADQEEVSPVVGMTHGEDELEFHTLD